MDATTGGEAVEERYKDLGLTQESLAWLAGVSNTTVRNVLHGRVGAARTWPHVERSLGWAPGSWERLRLGETPEELLPPRVLRSLLTALFRMKEAGEVRTEEVRDYHHGLLKDLWRYKEAAKDSDHEHEKGGPPESFEAFSRRQDLMSPLEAYWLMLELYLSPAEAKPVMREFQRLGWRKPRENAPAVSRGDSGVDQVIIERDHTFDEERILAAAERRRNQSGPGMVFADVASLGALRNVLVTGSATLPTNPEIKFVGLLFCPPDKNLGLTKEDLRLYLQISDSIEEVIQRHIASHPPEEG